MTTIKNQIQKEIRNFIRKYATSPVKIYIHPKLYYKLKAEADENIQYIIFSNGRDYAEMDTIFGLKIIGRIDLFENEFKLQADGLKWEFYKIKWELEKMGNG